jgi:hypothetical protein
MAKGRTQRYYDSNPKAKKRKADYDKKYNAKPENKKKRRELEKIRKKSKKRGVNTSKMDYDHATGRHVPKSVNRGRNEKSRLKGSKRS